MPCTRRYNLFLDVALKPTSPSLTGTFPSPDVCRESAHLGIAELYRSTRTFVIHGHDTVTMEVPRIFIQSTLELFRRETLEIYLCDTALGFVNHHIQLALYLKRIDIPFVWMRLFIHEQIHLQWA